MRTAFYNLIDWFNESFSMAGFNDAILPIKIISACLSIGLVVIIIYLILLIKKDIAKHLEMLMKRPAEEGEPEKTSIEGWQTVLDKLNSPNEADFKMAVIEADKIFDNLLKKNGYQGEDMGGRLKQVTQDQLPNIDEVWEAHKMRNRLVHEPDFQLRQHEAQKMIEIYQKAIENLEPLSIDKKH